MSDFDKRPPGDDEFPDWLNEPADSPRKDDSLGLTGNLDWQSIDLPEVPDDLPPVDPTDPERPAMMDDVDWMQTLRKSATGPLGPSSGLTGQLDWQQDQIPEADLLMPTDEDLPDWMKGGDLDLPDAPLPSAIPGVTRALWMDEPELNLPAEEPPPAPRQTGTIKRITGELPPVEPTRQTGTIKRITGELPPVELPPGTGTIKRLTGELPAARPVPSNEPDEISLSVEQDAPMAWLESFRAPDTGTLQPSWIDDADLPPEDALPEIPATPEQWGVGDEWQADQNLPEAGGEAYWLRDDLDDGSPLLSNEEMGMEAPVPLRRAGDHLFDEADDDLFGQDADFIEAPASSAQPLSAEDLDFLAGPLPIADDGNLQMPDLDALLGEQGPTALYSEEAAYLADNADEDPPDLDAILNATRGDDEYPALTFGEQPEPDEEALPIWDATLDNLFSEADRTPPPDLNAILSATSDDGLMDADELPSLDFGDLAAEAPTAEIADEALPAWDDSLDNLFSDVDRTPPPDFNALLADSLPDLGTIRLDDRPGMIFPDEDVDALFDPDAGTQLRRDALHRTTSELHLPDGALDSLFAQEPEADLTPPIEYHPPNTGDLLNALDEPDVFEQLGLSAPLTPPVAPKPTAAEIDARMDWFTDEGEPTSAPVPDWLQKLDTSSLEETPPLELFPEELEPEPPPRPFGGTGRINELKKPPTQVFNEPDPTDLAGLDDVDRLLASYSFDERSLPQTANLENALRPDFDLLDSDIEVEKAISAREQSRDEQMKAVTGMLSSDAPDWLKEAADTAAGPSEQVSAAAIIRKQGQREVPLNELSDRLQSLSQKGRALPTTKTDAPGEVLGKVLPGLSEVLPAVNIPTGTASARPDAAISKEQARNIRLLESLVGTKADAPSAVAPRRSAIDLTLDAPTTFDDILAEPTPAEEAAPAAKTKAKRTRRRDQWRFRPRLDRALIALMLLLAVGLPITAPALRIGNLPPAQFVAGSPAARAWSSVETVRGGDLVLIGAEYGPTGAAELDPALAAITQHILARGGHPVLVSSNPVGLLHAEQVIAEVAGNPQFMLLTGRSNRAYAYGEDYFVARYLPGEVIGLRSFAADVKAQLATNSVGQPSGLDLNSLRDFRLIVLIAERGDDVRAWAEQVAPLAAGPLVAAVGQGAAVLAQPYLLPGSIDPQPGLSGLVVGLRDAYTYGQQIQTLLASANAVDLIETRPPTQIPTLDPANATAAPEVSPTPEATATPSALIGEIDANTTVNVRAEPSTSGAILTRLQPGTEIAVLGRSANGEWVQVQLPDGQTGWISADFVSIRANETGAVPGSREVVSLLSDSSFAQAPAESPTPEATLAATRVPSMTGEQIESMVATLGPAAYLTLTAISLPPSATPEASLTPAPATETNVAGAGTHSEAPIVRTGFNTAQETQWYSMTLGLVMIVAILLLGLIVNLIGGLFKRERQRE
jgi:uncharacterized protein YgiM (DUF1202 family)